MLSSNLAKRSLRRSYRSFICAFSPGLAVSAEETMANRPWSSASAPSTCASNWFASASSFAWLNSRLSSLKRSARSRIDEVLVDRDGGQLVLINSCILRRRHKDVLLTSDMGQPRRREFVYNCIAVSVGFRALGERRLKPAMLLLQHFRCGFGLGVIPSVFRRRIRFGFRFPYFSCRFLGLPCHEQLLISATRAETRSLAEGSGRNGVHISRLSRRGRASAEIACKIRLYTPHAGSKKAHTRSMTRASPTRSARFSQEL